MGNLRFIWRYASHYPGRVAAAALSLLIASGATLAIPSGFKRVIDKGFVAGGGDITPYFHYLFMIVVVLALATASRSYLVSWLGERVVADISQDVQDNLIRLDTAFFDDKNKSEGSR